MEIDKKDLIEIIKEFHHFRDSKLQPASKKHATIFDPIALVRGIEFCKKYGLDWNRIMKLP